MIIIITVNNVIKHGNNDGSDNDIFLARDYMSDI